MTGGASILPPFIRRNNERQFHSLAVLQAL